MDFSAPLGYLLSAGVLVLAIVFHGNIHAFADVPSIAIVIGGTITVTLTSYSFPDILRAFSMGGAALTHNQPSFSGLARHLLQLAQKTRQVGLLGMQREAAGQSNGFLRQGFMLAVDGAPVETIEKILFQETASLMERQERSVAVLRKAAEVAPAMGLIATLIGLVQMLGQLSNPSAIGPAMAVAILGTFYGALISYVILTPLATKLERMGSDDLMSRKLITTAIVSMTKQENPRQLELHLNALLPPAQRVSVFR